MPPGTQTRPTRRRVERAKNKRRSKFLRNAIQFIDRGIPIFPVAKNGKFPLTKNGFQNASTDRKKIEWWAKEFPNANIGVPTGSASGFVVIDLDRKGDVDGVKEFKKFCTRLRIDLPETYRVKTPSGGEHIYFASKYAGLIRSGVRVLGPGIDVRGEGGYVVAEGSSIDGKRYRRVSGSLDDIAMLLGALRREIKSKKKRRQKKPGNGERTYPEGERNDSLFRDACTCLRNGCDKERTLDLVGALTSPPVSHRSTMMRWSR